MVRMSALWIGWACLAACGPGTTDYDEDGYPDGVDCGPSDAAVHPGADDPTVDGVDQDCDGVDGPGTGDDDAGDDDDADDDSGDDDIADDDAADDDSGDDDTAPGPAVTSRLCAGANTASNARFEARSCTGPLELAAGVSSNGKWTVTVGALRRTGG